MQNKNERFVELDALRGFAVLMVMSYHYTTKFGSVYGHPSALPFEISKGYLGVSLFFMVSGFVIFLTLERVTNYKDFIASRFARLYPAYWVAVILTYTVDSVFPLPGRVICRSHALLNLSMLQRYMQIDYLDGCYWTLSLELAFYTIMLCVFYAHLLNKMRIISIIWLCSMIVTKTLDTSSILKFPEILRESLLLDWANLFISGMMFYELWKDKSNMMITNLIIVAALLVEYYVRGWQSAIICTIFCMAFYCIIFKVPLFCRLLNNKPLVYLGTISYSLYLLHQNIGYVMLRQLYVHRLKPVVAIGITSATILFLASCMTAYIEIPIRRAISKWHTERRKA